MFPIPDALAAFYLTCFAVGFLFVLVSLFLGATHDTIHLPVCTTATRAEWTREGWDTPSRQTPVGMQGRLPMALPRGLGAGRATACPPST